MENRSKYRAAILRKDFKLDNMHERHLPDHLNPQFLFQGTSADLLVSAASGKINLLDLARRELASRGLDENGRWVGFQKARIIHSVK